MRLRQVLVDRALALDQIRHGVEPQPVDPEIEPELHHVDDRAEHPRIVEIEVGLVRIKAVPVIGLRHRVPGPVRLLGIEEDDPGFEEFLVGVAPDVEIAIRRAAAAHGARAETTGCWSEVWLTTSSVMTRSLRRCASRTKALKSAILP